MAIDKEKIMRFKSLMRKYVPKVISPEGATLAVFNAYIGPKIAKLKLDGHSDDEIIEILGRDE